jgi:hypothetical protein
MNEVDIVSQLQIYFLANKEPLALGAIFGGVITFFVKQWTLSANEKSQLDLQKNRDAQLRVEAKTKKAADFKGAIKSYIAGDTNGSISAFHLIATTGDVYFQEMENIAGLIIDKHISSSALVKTLIVEIDDCLNRSVPAYYGALSKLSVDLGQEQSPDFKRKDFQCMIELLEKRMVFMPSAANTPSNSGSPDAP